MKLFDQYGEDELKIIPIKNIPGLIRQPWVFTRGMLLYREAKDSNDKLRARIEYTYTIEDSGRQAYPHSRTIKWYKEDGTVGLEKTDLLKYSVKDLKHEKRKVRQARMDYMEGAAEELANLSLTMPEPYKTSFMEASQAVENILNHYEVEIDHYIKRGDMNFENAVRNETDSNIISVLNLIVRPPDTQFSQGLTIKQTILHQLTGEYNP